MILASMLAAAVQAAPPADGQQISREEAQKRLAACGSRRFQSVAEFPVNGKIRRAQLNLCAGDSETNEEWIATLQRNEAIVRAQTALPDSAKDKLLADLKGAIDQLRGVNALVPANGAGLTARGSVVVPKSDFEVSALPPLPAPIKKAPGAPPTTSQVASGIMPMAQRPVVPAALKPRLSVKCAAPNNSPIACDRIAMDESLVFEAEENLASALMLTFRQAKSGAQSEVAVRRLKQGQSVRMAIPAAICKGVGRATFDIELTGTGTGKMPYRDVIGPFTKSC